MLLVGGFVIGAMTVRRRQRRRIGSSAAGSTSGSPTDMRDDLDHGPYFQTGGGRCGFWLALENGDIVAYKVEQPVGLHAQRQREKFDRWECDRPRISPQRSRSTP